MEPGPGPFRISPKVIVGATAAVSIFSTLQAYNYVSLFTDREPSFPMLLLLNTSFWICWALLVPGIIWMGRRFPLQRDAWVRHTGIHIVSVALFVFSHAVLTVSLRGPILTWMGRDWSWWPAFQQLFFLNFDWEMMVYWGVLGVSMALDFHRSAQAQALNAAQLETRLAEASLQSLQRQLHPHFLFNTLHTISALVHKDPEAADAMLAQLSDLLRLTLDRVGTQEVPLKEELDFLEKYIDIERTRFGERLQVSMHVEPETLDAAVPNLLLQPLVENAIRHGIAKKVDGGRVEIGARRDGDTLCLSVRDTGPGLSADKRSALTTGVGLSNTRSRLAQLFGERHRFEFHEPADGGLAVQIAIPYSVDDPESHPDADMESVA
jgi:signal transduction histidine kinase